jgi:hypothetical protein
MVVGSRKRKQSPSKIVKKIKKSKNEEVEDEVQRTITNLLEQAKNNLYTTETIPDSSDSESEDSNTSDEVEYDIDVGSDTEWGPWSESGESSVDTELRDEDNWDNKVNQLEESNEPDEVEDDDLSRA